MTNQEKNNETQQEQGISEGQEGQSQIQNQEENPKGKQGISLVVHNKASGLEAKYALEEGKEIIVGASPECSGIVISDPYISGRHFSITLKDGKVEVKDLGSTNGLYLQLTEPVEFSKGHILLAGMTNFKLESRDE